MPDKSDEIAEILKAVRDGAALGKVVLVVGDGIEPQHAIRPRPDYLGFARSSGKTVDTLFEEDRVCWRYYETHRWTSWNVHPASTYNYVWRLCYENFVHCIITTNYDLWFDSMFHKDPLPQGVILNPVASDHEYRHQGFYGLQSEINHKLRLLKIHGSLDFASFMECPHPEPHIFRFPQFLIGFPKENPVDEFALPAHDYLGHDLASFGTVAPSLKSDGCDRIGHLIDFNFPRSVFSRLMEKAIEELVSPDVKLVLLIGFTGYFDPGNPHDPFNEELVPVLLDIADRVPVFHLLNSNQYPSRSYLYQQLQTKTMGKTLHDWVRGFIGDVMRKISHLVAGDDTLWRGWRDYYENRWLLGHLFLPPR